MKALVQHCATPTNRTLWSNAIKMSVGSNSGSDATDVRHFGNGVREPPSARYDISSSSWTAVKCSVVKSINWTRSGQTAESIGLRRSRCIRIGGPRSGIALIMVEDGIRCYLYSIRMLHQEFKLARHFSVCPNRLLGSPRPYCIKPLHDPPHRPTGSKPKGQRPIDQTPRRRYSEKPSALVVQVADGIALCI
jgi:hypothetical protein